MEENKEDVIPQIIAEIASFRDKIEGKAKNQEGRTDVIGMAKVHVLDKLIMHLRRKFGILTV